MLRGFRARLAEQKAEGSSFAGGYVAAMLDVTAEYEAVAMRASDRHEARKLAEGAAHRAVLRELLNGPARPHELAARVDLDMGSVVCALEELRDGELVRRYPTGDVWREEEPADGEAGDDRRAATQRDVFGSPYRLTVEGERVARELGTALPEGFELGVSLAVEMFSQLLRHAVLTPSKLASSARELLADRAPARAALDCWVRAATDAGLLSELGAGLQAAIPSAQRHRALWHSIPSLLSQLQRHKHDNAPVYVRSGYAWDVWEAALQQARPGYPLINGEALAGGPPSGERFALLYDHPATAGADLREPAMQRVVDEADARFVVASSRDTIPDGFFPLELSMADD